MFAVFARFNPLITRPRVNNAVKEFQMQLISTVNLAIQKLQQKFTQKFENSNASQISHVRGIPPFSGILLWAKQIERQVDALRDRMEDVMGVDWGKKLQGIELNRSIVELKNKLDTKNFVRKWVKDWEKDMATKAMTNNVRLSSYPIIVVPEGTNNSLIAKVNFDEKNEQLFREIRYLKWLGWESEIPKTVRMIFQGFYPF